MGSTTTAERRYATILALLMLFTLTTALGGGEARGIPTGDRPSSQPCSESLVIQGRITVIEGAFVTVKTPDGYPGGPGVHAQFVKAGPTVRTDVSHARILLPDGRQPDTRPLGVDDRVVMVLNGPAGPGTPNAPAHIYVACVVERVAESDKIVTH